MSINTTLPVSLAQIDIAFGDPQKNLAQVSELTAAAAESGSQLLVLPELWSTGYDLSRAAEHATPVAQGMFAAVAELARRHQIHIVGSLLSRLPEGGFGNTAVWVDSNGRSSHPYTKLHLFRLMDEDQYLTAGEAPLLLDTPFGRAGLAICYDLRFPELFRLYALHGAQLIIVPAEWPHPRLNHWRTLLRARAIENQLFVVACNRVGRAGETHFCGHSMVIDPWGNILEEGGESPELLQVTLDLSAVPDIRRKIPVFADRRPERYAADSLKIDDQLRPSEIHK